MGYETCDHGVPVEWKCGRCGPREALGQRAHRLGARLAANMDIEMPEPFRAELLALGATPLCYFPNAPVKKDYVVLTPDMIANGPDSGR